ncbi:DNA-binding transcriptional LysR family regulator [Actinoplanes lutulentus]|uniref:DNA-binding transcriptional LysR family regulator n=1 Tax=Actinoplanes lutulentus TaxID=1287878 RepID=A0A327YWX8_9ACTN|nr:LysR family transcriptional regulator [Actinoplanes lutulentus]MBB2940452.1 DNA-binding transcriptional LysR family regulator [Actinoplanes lutulentus]RAK25816.1 DNA-binding transcriptional LysR family regulator [Actinoplanes lutulentus]
MFDLHRLRLLRELKHRGTLAAVAEALSYAPSTVSQQLSQLEAEAGVPLLEPVGRRVRLTPQAEILVAHTEAVLERLERARAEIAGSLTEVAGTLRIASFQTAALALVPAALSRLRELHPRLRVEVTQMEPEQALSALRAHDCDLVIVEEYPGIPLAHPADLHAEELLDDPLHLAGLEKLEAGHPWVMEPAGTSARDWATNVCRAAGFEPDVRFETADLLLHLRLVEQGHAVALLPGLVFHGRPPTVPLHPLSEGRRLFTVTRRGRGTHPAVRAGRDALKAAAA